MEKLFYSIGEVASMFDVNTSTIRFWEKEFSFLKPHKNKKGNRMFREEDIEDLKLIHHLLKEKGMTIAGVKKKIKENRGGEIRNMEVIKKLENIKEKLLGIKKELS